MFLIYPALMMAALIIVGALVRPALDRVRWLVNRSVLIALAGAAWALIILIVADLAGMRHIRTVNAVAVGPVLCVLLSLFVYALLYLPLEAFYRTRHRVRSIRERLGQP